MMLALLFCGFVLQASLLAAQELTINCRSWGLENGYQGVDNWRASTKDCADATNKLESQFGQIVPTISNGCSELASSGSCSISICDSSLATFQSVYYQAVWAAARVVHGRHKHDGTVAGYVSIDDYWYGGKAFVQVARTGSPDPGNKRRSLAARRGVAEGKRAGRNETEGGGNGGDDEELIWPRVELEYSSFDSVDVPNTDGLSVNIRAGWGEGEWTPRDQQEYAQERLVEAWRGTTGEPGDIRPAGYLAPGGIMIEMELVAHNNHNLRQLHENEINPLARFAIDQRGIAGNPNSFIMQIRRGGESIAHMVLRVFRLTVSTDPNGACGYP